MTRTEQIAHDQRCVTAALTYDLDDESAAAFTDMQAKLASVPRPLTDKQREWVLRVLARNDDDLANPEPVSAATVPKGRPTPKIDAWLADKGPLRPPPPRPR